MTGWEQEPGSLAGVQNCGSRLTGRVAGVMVVPRDAQYSPVGVRCGRDETVEEQLVSDGLRTVGSAFGVRETIDRLAAAAAQAGLLVFARIDHGRRAREVGLDLRPTELLIFGHPRGGTPLSWRASRRAPGTGPPHQPARPSRRRDSHQGLPSSATRRAASKPGLPVRCARRSGVSWCSAAALPLTALAPSASHTRVCLAAFALTGAGRILALDARKWRQHTGDPELPLTVVEIAGPGQE